MYGWNVRFEESTMGFPNYSQIVFFSKLFKLSILSSSCNIKDSFTLVELLSEQQLLGHCVLSLVSFDVESLFTNALIILAFIKQNYNSINTNILVEFLTNPVFFLSLTI